MLKITLKNRQTMCYLHQLNFFNQSDRKRLNKTRTTQEILKSAPTFHSQNKLLQELVMNVAWSVDGARHHRESFTPLVPF